MRFGLRVDFFGLRGRVLGLAHKAATQAGHRCDFLPKLFSDERNHRVRQTQDGFERADQRAACGALFGRAAVLNLNLGNFQVPVTKLVPDKLVNAAGHVVQPVVGKALGHVGFHALQR